MIDTPAKRMSMLNFADGSNLTVLPTPNGAYDAADIQQLLDLYSGIILEDLILKSFGIAAARPDRGFGVADTNRGLVARTPGRGLKTAEFH